MRRLTIKFSIYDADTGEVIVENMEQGPSNIYIKHCDIDNMDGIYHDHSFNIKVSTLEKK